MIYEFEFIDMRTADSIIDWDNVPVVDLSHYYLDNK